MPLVFVHGVNTREGITDNEKSEFRTRVSARDELFRSISLAGLVRPPARLRISNPYWGAFGATLTERLAFVPGPGTETFGAATSDDVVSEVLSQTLSPDAARQLKDAPESGALLALARQQAPDTLVKAIDALVAVGASKAGQGGDAATVEDLARFASAMGHYLRTTPDLGWLSETDPRTGQPRIADDDQFIEALWQRLKPFLQVDPGPEQFGSSKVLDWLKIVVAELDAATKKTARAIAATATGGVGAFVGAIGGAAVAGSPGGGALVKLVRPAATRRAGIFLGDVLTYLNNRGDRDNPGEIVRVVCEDLRSADKSRSVEDERLVVVAHSMGGNIVYDILTHFDPGIQVDALVTVGSQVALFKELRLYLEDKAPGSSPRRPNCVRAWLNVFDPLDVLGFAASGIFDGVHDFAFSTQASALDAHSTYFLRPHFHERLRERLTEFGLVPA